MSATPTDDSNVRTIILSQVVRTVAVEAACLLELKSALVRAGREPANLQTISKLLDALARRAIGAAEIFDRIQGEIDAAYRGDVPWDGQREQLDDMWHGELGQCPASLRYTLALLGIAAERAAAMPVSLPGFGERWKRWEVCATEAERIGEALDEWVQEQGGYPTDADAA